MARREPLVYFHGMPGGPSEILAVRGTALLDGGDYVPNRQTLNVGADLCGHFDGLASAIQSRFGKCPVHIVGFSLGAYVALEVARRLGSEVSRISLVSAAAPLSSGNFLPDMAGKAVFRCARHAPLLFAALTSLQSFALRGSPDRFFDTLFASAQGMDRDLAKQPHFRTNIMAALNECLGDGRSNYRREVTGYVEDWSTVLPLVKQPVELWHGRLDNWAPPLMADALALALPNVTRVHMLDGQSHYSTLQTFFEEHRNQVGA